MTSRDVELRYPDLASPRTRRGMSILRWLLAAWNANSLCHAGFGLLTLPLPSIPGPAGPALLLAALVAYPVSLVMLTRAFHHWLTWGRISGPP